MKEALATLEELKAEEMAGEAGSQATTAQTRSKAAASETAAAAPAKKKIVKRQPKKEEEGLKDYSGLYTSFYDIFVGQQLEPKSFDLNHAVRETRNVYASFVNLLDTNAVAMKQKF